MSQKIVLFLVIIGIIFIGMMTIFPLANFRKYYDRLFFTESTTFPTPTLLATPSVIPTPSNSDACYNFTLTDTESGEKIFETITGNHIKSYDKRVLFSENKQGINGANLFAYDPETKTKNTVFTYPRTEQDRMLSELTNIYILQDKIYFGVGGYFAPGGFYRMDSLDSEPIEISKISNPQVVTIHDKEYLWGGNGDGCGGMGGYSKLNLDTGTVTEPFLELGMGCVAGEDIVYQGADYWYISNHTEKKTEPVLRPFGHVHTNLIKILPVEPFTRTTLIDENTIPENITDIAFLGGRFILSGETPISVTDQGIYSSKKNIYTFNPDDNNIEEITSIDTGECTMHADKAKPDTVCYSCYGSENASEIVVDLKTKNSSKKILKNEEQACTGYEDYNFFQQDAEVTVNDKIEELELPANLKLSCDS